MAGSIGEAAVEIIADISKFGSGLKKRLSDTVRRAAQAIPGPIRSAFQRAFATTGLAVSAGKRIGQALAKAIPQPVKDAVSRALSAAASTAGTAGRRVGQVLARAIPPPVRAAVSQVFSSVASTAAAAGTRVGQALARTVPQPVKDALSKVGEGLKASLSRVGSTLGPALSGIASKVGPVLSSAATTAARAWGQAAGAVGKVAGQIGPALVSAAGAAASALGRAASVVSRSLVTGVQAAAAATAALAGSAVAAGVSYNILGQRAMAAMTTLLGTRKAARQMMADLKEFATSSPFPRQAFIRATQQLLGFGLEAKKVIPVLGAIQDAVAATGGGADEIARMTDIFANIRSAGKLTGVELARFGPLAINATEILSKQLGKTGDEIADAVSKGAIDADTAIDALVKGLREKFGGAAAGLKDTFVGALDSVKGALRDIGGKLVEPFIGFERGGAAVTGLNNIAAALRHLEKEALPLVLPAVERLAGAFERVTEKIKAGVKALDSDAFAGLAKSLEGLGPLIAAVGVGFGTSFLSGLPVIGSLLSGINPLVAAFGALIATSPQLRSAFSDAFGTIMEAVKPLLPVLAGLGRDLLTALTPLLSTLASGLGTVLTGLVQAFQPLMPVVVQLASTLATALAPVITAVATALSGILAALGPVITGIVSALMPILPPLASVLAQIASVVGSALVTVLQAAGPVLAELASAVVEVLQAVLPLVPALLPLVTMVAQLAAGIVSALLPVLVPLIKFLADLARVIIPPLVSIVGVLARVLSAVLGPAISLVSGIGKLFGNIISKVGSMLTGFVGGMVNIGRNLIQGLINGVKQMAGAVIDAAKSVVKGAIDGAKRLLGISSPSKVFAKMGRDVALGWIIGLTSMNGKVTDAAVKLARGIIAVSKQLGPGLVKALTSSTSKIDSTLTSLQKKIADAFKGVRTKIDDRLIKHLGKQNKRLQSLAKQRDAIAERIKEATKYAADVAGKARDFASLSAIASGADVPLTGEGLARQLKDRLKQIRAFQTDLNRLAKRGLHKDILGDIIDQGPEKGAALAATLVGSSDAVLRSLTSTQASIRAASKKLGDSSANLLFDSGKAAGAGFLAGLKAQQKDIVKLMTQIAREVAKTVKTTLKIKSPSRVMEGAGIDTIAGFIAGVQRMARSVEAAVRRAIPSDLLTPPQITLTPAVRQAAGNAPPFNWPPPPPPPSGGGQQARPSRVTEIHAPVTVNAYGSDPRLLGDSIAARILAAVR